MPPRPLNAPTRALVAIVVTLGALTFAALLVSWDPAADPAWPILVFGPAALATVTTSAPVYRGSLPSAAAFQLGTAFVFALFLVSGPAPAAIVAGLMGALDWATARRSNVVGLFNVAQLVTSAGAGAAVERLLVERSAASGLAAIVVFSAVNHALTHLVVGLSGRRPLRSLPVSLGDGVRAELLCIACGVLMGLLWRQTPWLALLGAVPLISYAGALAELARRKVALDRRERELRALEELAARLGEARGEDLPRTFTHDISASFDASGAMLAVVEPAGPRLLVVAAHGIAATAGPSIPISRFADGFFETRAVRRIDDLRRDLPLYPELAFLGAGFVGGALAVPLRVGSAADGLVLLLRGPERRPFDEEDARRLALLARLLEPALRTEPPR